MNNNDVVFLEKVILDNKNVYKMFCCLDNKKEKLLVYLDNKNKNIEQIVIENDLILTKDDITLIDPIIMEKILAIIDNH